MDALVAELADGPAADLDGVVRSGGDELTAAIAAFDAGLEVDGWQVERGPVEVDGATATAPLTITLATETFGDVVGEHAGGHPGPGPVGRRRDRRDVPPGLARGTCRWSSNAPTSRAPRSWTATTSR